MSASVASYVARRLLGALLVLAVVSWVIFLFIHVAPGGPEQTIGGRLATPAQLEDIRERYGLDDPLTTQYARFVASAVQLDFGSSFTTRQPVTEAVSRGLQVTAPLLLVSFLLIVVIGTVLGTLAAYRAGSRTDRALVGFAVAGASAPAFATAMILLYVFAVELAWLPAFGNGEGFVDRARHLVIPVVTLTVVGAASMLKITRARVAHVLGEDHVTFARARGHSTWHTLTRSVLRNSGVQIATMAGVVMLELIAGCIVVEIALSLNGAGALLVSAVSTRDIPLVQGLTLLITVFILAVNILVDLFYFVIDPRLRSGSITA